MTLIPHLNPLKDNQPNLLTLQGKDPLVEVIKEVFSVIKLAKIVKKAFATTSVYGYGGFGGAFNENSTQIKKKWVVGGYYGCFFIGALLWI